MKKSSCNDKKKNSVGPQENMFGYQCLKQICLSTYSNVSLKQTDDVRTSYKVVAEHSHRSVSLYRYVLANIAKEKHLQRNIFLFDV